VTGKAQEALSVPQKALSVLAVDGGIIFSHFSFLIACSRSSPIGGVFSADATSRKIKY